MGSFIDSIRGLKSRKIKITRVREALIEYFHQGHKPTSALELQELLHARGLLANKSTVYRELAFLKTEGLIKEIHFGDDKVRYELSSNDDCHHHVVCINCKKVEDVELEEEALLNSIEKQSGFAIQQHSVEFFGLCINCQ